MPQKYQNEKSPILNGQKKPKTSGKVQKIRDLEVKVDKFLNIRIVSGEFIFILQMFTLQIVDKSTSYTFKIVN